MQKPGKVYQMLSFMPIQKRMAHEIKQQAPAKCEAIFGNKYLINYWTRLFFKLGIQSHVYGGYEMYEFGTNWPSIVIEIQGVKICNLTVPVNNTLVCCMSLLATDIWLCVDSYVSLRMFLYVFEFECLHDMHDA